MPLAVGAGRPVLCQNLCQSAGLGNPHRPRREHLVKSINAQFFLPYRSRCVAEYRHSSSYLGAAMGAATGLEDPVGPFASFRGMLPSAEVAKTIGRPLPLGIARHDVGDRPVGLR